MMDTTHANFFIDLSALLFYAYYILRIWVHLQQTDIYSEGWHCNFFKGWRGWSGFANIYNGEL